MNTNEVPLDAEIFVTYDYSESIDSVLLDFDNFDYDIGFDAERFNMLLTDTSGTSLVHRYTRETATSWHWSGILYAEPWCDLDADYGESEIVELIIKHHIANDPHTCTLSFKLNTDSPLNNFFIEYADGYGGNIPGNLKTIMRYLVKQILTDPDVFTYTEREQTEYYCEQCDHYFYSYDIDITNCPLCDTEIESL